MSARHPIQYLSNGFVCGIPGRILPSWVSKSDPVWRHLLIIYWERAEASVAGAALDARIAQYQRQACVHPDGLGTPCPPKAYATAPEPPPRASDAPAAWDLVLKSWIPRAPVGYMRSHIRALLETDIAARDEMGTRKYGQRLRPNDGRDSLVDAYQEAMDLVVYLAKAEYENDSGQERLRRALNLCADIRTDLYTRDGR